MVQDDTFRVGSKPSIAGLVPSGVEMNHHLVFFQTHRDDITE